MTEDLKNVAGRTAGHAIGDHEHYAESGDVDSQSHGPLGGIFVHGVTWTAVGNYGRVVLQLGVNMILARRLAPAEFGVLAMVVVYTGFVGLLGEAGLSAAVIQKRNLDQEALSTFFWFAVGVGTLLAGLSWFIAPFIEAFYHYSGLASVVRVMSVLFLFIGFNAVPFGLLRKAVRFRALALANLLAALLGGGAAIWAALGGLGYWALVVNVLATTGLGAIFNFGMVRWKPQFTFRPTRLWSALSYSLGVLGFNTVNYWARAADRLIIGKMLGAASLGYYSQGYKLLRLPLSSISGVILPTLHPVLAKMQDQPVRMAHAYLRLLKLISMISFPLGAFLLVFAHPLVMILWGKQWGPSVTVVRILSVLVMLQPPVTTTGPVLLARNRTGIYFWMSVGATVFTILGMAIGLHWGIEGVAAGYAVAWCTAGLLLIFLALRTALPIPLVKILSTFIWPTVAAVVVGAVGTAVAMFLPRTPFIALGLGGLIWMAVIAVMLFRMRGSLRLARPV